MQPRVRALGHPVHPMLVMFPVALFVTGAVFDVIAAFTDNGTFSQVSFWSITVGLIGAVLAALTGVADWTGIPAQTRAKAVGLRHGLLNGVVVVLFIISWALRVNATEHRASVALVIVEVIAVAIASVSAWLGGELVDRLGIGVHEDANPDAPSSLRSRPTRVTTGGSVGAGGARRDPRRDDQ
jgi:uncharacterized membrane protein